jgi:hypothetical protein
MIEQIEVLVKKDVYVSVQFDELIFGNILKNPGLWLGHRADKTCQLVSGGAGKTVSSGKIP